MEIKRYNIGYMGLEEAAKGRFVSHGDHVEIVMKLEAEIEKLKAEVQEIYSKEASYWGLGP